MHASGRLGQLNALAGATLLLAWPDPNSDTCCPRGQKMAAWGLPGAVYLALSATADGDPSAKSRALFKAAMAFIAPPLRCRKVCF